jgi:hypothetical protein
VPSLGAAIVLSGLLGAAPPAGGPTRLFLVSYSPTQSQALELRCDARGEGGLDCKGVQLIVTKQKGGECTVQQWPVHGLPLERGGNERWRALLPSKICTNFSTVYLLERQSEFRWQLTLETVQTGKPRDALESSCSSSDFPPRVVYVSDHSAVPEPAEMGCSVVRLTP